LTQITSKWICAVAGLNQILLMVKTGAAEGL